MKKKSILVSYDVKSSAVEVGVISVLSYIKTQFNQEFTAKPAKDITKEELKECRFLINIRGADVHQLELMKQARKINVYTIYFLDDDLLNMNEFISVNNRLFYEREDVKKNIRETMDLADCLWTVNEELSNKYAHLFRHHFTTRGPALLLNDIRKQQGGYNEKRNDFTEDEQIVRIGFAGGLDHRSFFETLLMNPLKRLAKEYGEKIQFCIYGFLPFQMYMIPIHSIPYDTNFKNYKIRMRTLRWDIGMAPLPETDFHSMKYINKYLEYGALGIPAIYSDVRPYNQKVKQGETGLLIPNDQEKWYKGLKQLIEMPELRSQIGQESKKDVESHYHISMIAEEVMDHFRRLV